jgi:hypothetical protein
MFHMKDTTKNIVFSGRIVPGIAEMSDIYLFIYWYCIFFINFFFVCFRMAPHLLTRAVNSFILDIVDELIQQRDVGITCDEVFAYLADQKAVVRLRRAVMEKLQTCTPSLTQTDNDFTTIQMNSNCIAKEIPAVAPPPIFTIAIPTVISSLQCPLQRW